MKKRKRRSRASVLVRRAFSIIARAFRVAFVAGLAMGPFAPPPPPPPPPPVEDADSDGDPED